MRKRRLRFALGLTVLATAGSALGWILMACGPAGADLPRHLGRPAAWMQWLEHNPPDQTVAATAGLLVYLLLAWLALAVLASCAASLPGLGGRVAARAATSITPRSVRRLVAGVLGVAMTTGIAGPVAADTSRPGIDWPAAARTTGSAPASPVIDTPPATAASTAVITPPTPAGAAATAPVPVAVAPVIVAAGDCLWDIAERRLGASATAARVAAAWPRWYAANRAVIGADPDLLHPGQRLQQPAD